MAVSTIVARGFGAFGGGVNKVPTRGYSPGSAIAGPYWLSRAATFAPGASAGASYVAGASSGAVYTAGAVEGQASSG